ncbi:hypothetical protein ACQ4PT_004450 [Festuca glaucescens]
MAMTTVLVSLVLLLASSSAWVFSGSNNGRVKNITLYMHEIVSGPNATAIMLVPTGVVPNKSFGMVKLLDNELRDGPDLSNSSIVGRFQGVMFYLGLVTPDGKQTGISFMFTTGEYNGSSLAVTGPLESVDGAYERAVVGGTGKFRMARGYSLVTFVSNPTPVSMMFKVRLFLKMDA